MQAETIGFKDFIMGKTAIALLLETGKAIVVAQVNSDFTKIQVTLAGYRINEDIKKRYQVPDVTPRDILNNKYRISKDLAESLLRKKKPWEK